MTVNSKLKKIPQEVERERPQKREKKALYFSAFNSTLLLLLEQGVCIFILHQTLQMIQPGLSL